MIGLVKAASEMEKQALSPKLLANALQRLQKASPERLYNPTTGGLKIKGEPLRQLLPSYRLGGADVPGANLSNLNTLNSIERSLKPFDPQKLMPEKARAYAQAYYAQQAKQLAQSHNGASFINYLKRLGINS